MEAGWQALAGVISETVAVRAEGRSDTDVTVTVTVSPSAAEPVWFSDNLYGVTAWAWDGTQWQRVDTAEMRLMIAPSLGPGEQATVTLPIAGQPGQHDRLRVLIRTPADGFGAWAEVN